MITQLPLLSIQPPLRTLRSWWRNVTRYFDPCNEALGDHQAATRQPLPVRHDDVAAPRRSAGAGDAVHTRADVLLFPIRGEAVLVRLAEMLRSRAAKQKPTQGLLLLTVPQSPGTRLLIDGVAHVDYLRDSSTYRLSVETIPDTRVIVETGDFDTLVRLIVQYLNDRLSEPAAAEASL